MNGAELMTRQVLAVILLCIPMAALCGCGEDTVEIIEPGEDKPENTITGRDDLPMVLIPAGEFQMGDAFGEGLDNDEPVHTVYVDSFYMDKYEVTNNRYAEFLNEYGANTDAAGNVLLDVDSRWCLIERLGYGYRPKSGYGDHPVVEVSWYGAAAYAQFYDKRLPTEAEWEKAARGGLPGKRFSWGDEIDPTKANYDHGGSRNWVVSDMLKYLKRVGSFPPNGYQLYDMAGNVWEWCSDWYDDHYYVDSPKQNPTGPVSGTYRVLRGESWLAAAYNLGVARRYGGPADAGGSVGFRCAVDFIHE